MSNKCCSCCSTNVEQCIMWCWTLKYALQYVESCWTKIELGSIPFNNLIENPLERGRMTDTEYACLTRLCHLDANWTGTKICVLQRWINITYISHSLMSDIDECAAQVNPCVTVAKPECMNTDGSYNCLCKGGFVMEGSNCEGINNVILFIV